MHASRVLADRTFDDGFIYSFQLRKSGVVIFKTKYFDSVTLYLPVNFKTTPTVTDNEVY